MLASRLVGVVRPGPRALLAGALYKLAAFSLLANPTVTESAVGGFRRVSGFEGILADQRMQVVPPTQPYTGLAGLA
jgi:hypothetical protein